MGPYRRGLRTTHKLGKAAQGSRFVVLLGEDTDSSVTEEGTVGCPGETEFNEVPIG